MKAAALAFVVAATLAAGAPQQPARDTAAATTTGTAVVSGVLVTDEADPKPIRRARVTLGSDASGWTVVSDEGGAFEFTSLPAGQYLLRATKEGYVRAAYGARHPEGAGTPLAVGEGAQVTGLTLRMLRGAVITGVVRDERGRPVNAPVSVLRWEIRNGARVLTLDGDATPTDDRGVYRLWGLPPGEYLVRVGEFSARIGEPSGIRQITSADIQRARAAVASGRPLAPASPTPAAAPLPNPPVRTYVPVYYPGVTDPMAATWITLAPGEERSGVDLTRVLVPTATIRGTVAAAEAVPVSIATTTVSLTSRADQLLSGPGLTATASRHPDENGRFAFQGLAPGTYTVSARLAVPGGRPTTPPPGGGRGSSAPSAPTALFASEIVTLQGDDAAVSMTLRPGARVSGRLVFDGTAPRPSGFSPLGFVLRPVDAGGAATSLSFRADATFVVAGVPPGRYVLGWAPPPGTPWYLVASVANRQDTLDTPIDLEPGDVVTDWTITLGDAPSVFSGQLQDASGRGASDYVIIVFARDKARWTPQSRWIAATRPGTDGRFEVKGLPPGDYFVSAVTDVEAGQWFVPAFLETIAPAAAPVTLAAGQRTVQDFRIGG
jgi:Carboxypeptidase regulatory-like domain